MKLQPRTSNFAGLRERGYAAQTIQMAENSVSLVLDMTDTPELLSKGLARDITRRIQSTRKDMNLEIEDSITLEIWMKDAPELFDEDRDWILNETRARSANFNLSAGEGDSFEVDGSTIWYNVERV